MKKLLLATVASAALAFPALAQDAQNHMQSAQPAQQHPLAKPSQTGTRPGHHAGRNSQAYIWRTRQSVKPGLQQARTGAKQAPAAVNPVVRQAELTPHGAAIGV